MIFRWYLFLIHSELRVEVEEASIKTTVVETVEVVGEEGEVEAKNQKTLADFF